jgi:apolipoprotein D and lipocalin family protein
MKILFITTIIFSFLQSQTPPEYSKAPNPVDYVSPEKFSGLWYEIARTYNSFEKDCVAATVEYVLTEDMNFEIKNRCFDTVIGGDLIEYNGTAKPLNQNTMAQIQMTYFWIFTKNYRVVYLNEDYSSAVVVDKNMNNVWILNRTPFMEKKKLDYLVSFLSKYMDTKRLIYTPQDSQGRYK